MQLRALLGLLERELGLALAVPVEQEPFGRLGDHDRRVPLLAVVPAEDAGAAFAGIELDVVRKPLLQLIRVGERLPDLVGRNRELDLATDFHEVLQSATARLRILSATERLHFTREAPCRSFRWWSSRTAASNGRSTSTRGSCGNASSSSARR